eukprot:GHVS01074372.1.p1 GENE.GHVS01074372.1~~GHVS01074372.1.p1  ORF type:complete len:212 (-),score=11.57 GHVS01074372.1:287-922(-)
MSPAPVSYASTAVSGVQLPQRFDLHQLSSGGFWERGMHGQSRQKLPLKGRGLALLIAGIFTTFLVAVTLISDFMFDYTERKILEPILLVVLAVVTVLHFLERRKEVATPRMVYCCTAFVFVATLLALVQIYSVVKICVDLSGNMTFNTVVAVFLLCIVLIGVGSCFIVCFSLSLQIGIVIGSVRKAVLCEPRMVPVVPQGVPFVATGAVQM